MTEPVGSPGDHSNSGSAARSGDVDPEPDPAARPPAGSLTALQQEHYRLVVEHSADIIVQTRYGTIEWVSPSVHSILGWEPPEVIGTDWISLTTEDDAPVIRQARLDEFSGDTSTVRMRLRRKDGSLVWVDINSNAVLDERGHFDGLIVSTVRDVQVEVETDLALARTTELLAASQHLAKVGAWEVDLADGSLFWTTETYRLLDTDPAEFRPTVRSVTVFYTPESLEMTKQLSATAMRTGAPTSAEVELITASQRSIWVHVTVAPLFTDGQIAKLAGIFQDITERRNAELALAEAESRRRILEHQLQEAQKMEAIGALAGAIAHDFSNVLGVVMGNVELAAVDLPSSHPSHQSLDRIARAGAAARGLIQRLLSFSRTQPQRLQPEDLVAVIRETVDLLASSRAAGTDLSITAPESPVMVLADRTQIGQVVMNLCMNALQATDGADISIRLALGDVQVTDEARIARLAPGRYAHLSVSDSGSGMDASTQARIFEPFFTTKPEGQGTGLGLGIARSIVESHGGAITVDSTPGHGSVFHVYLPVASEFARS